MPDIKNVIIHEESFEQAGDKKRFPDLEYLMHIEGGFFTGEHELRILGSIAQIRVNDLVAYNCPKATHAFGYKCYSRKSQQANFWIEFEAYGPKKVETLKKDTTRLMKFE